MTRRGLRTIGEGTLSFAIVFPGQGSQSTGMQARLAADYEEVRRTWSEAGEALDLDLWGIAQSGPDERLGDTTITQPAMLAAGVAAWRAWQGAGGSRPAAMAGHSLGEYTALVCADALPFGDAVRLVRRRAELMQAAVPVGQGAMAAVLGLDDAVVVGVCRDAAGDEVVEAVNFNSPGQVVIAGHRSAVERATERARTAGAKRAVMLNVSVPSHCRLMKPAAAELARTLQAMDFRAPSIPVLSNVDVEVLDSAERICTALERQLYNPVRWADIVRRFAADGITAVIECGPGKVLTGLTRRIDRSLEAVSFDAPEAVADAVR